MAKVGIPWDVYIDERKLGKDSALGFLVVPNTASFMHKLHRCRFVKDHLGQTMFRPHEVHWHAPRLDTVGVAEQWIYRVFQHRGVKFYRKPWPRGMTKEMVILDFLKVFCRTRCGDPPFDVVAFLDFDDAHATVDIQNSIMRTANIARCYHLDSLNNDCLQCCDLLLGATSLLWNDPSLRFEYERYREQRQADQKLTDGQIKRYLAGYLACHIDRDSRCVYDFRHKRARVNR